MRLSKFIALLAAAGVVALSACTTGPTIRADADPSANLNSYKTFGFYDRVSTDKNAYTTLVSTRLKDATRREMEKRGYQYAQNPQLLVNFNINIENRQCGWRSCKVVMKEGGVIRSEAVRHPTRPLHPDTRAQLIELAREVEPLALRWGL